MVKEHTMAIRTFRVLENLKETSCQSTKSRMHLIGTITINSSFGKEKANLINTTVSRNAGSALKHHLYFHNDP